MSLRVIPIFWFEFLGDFWRKIGNRGKQEKLGTSPFAATTTFVAAKGGLAAERPRAKKATPQVCCSEALLRRSEDTVHNGPKFLFCFRKSCIHAPIVWGP